MSTSKVRLAIAGYTGLTSGGLGQGRGQPCSAPCTAGPPSRPVSPSARAAAQCEILLYGSHSEDLLGPPQGCSPPTSWAVQLAPWESQALSALEPTVGSSPVTTSFTLCVASEQPAGCNYRLGLFRAVLLLADTYSRLTHEGEGILFSNVDFQAQAFALQWTGSAA